MQLAIDGYNSIVFHADFQQVDRQIPQIIKPIAGQLIGRRLRIDSQQEQDFGAVDIAYAGDDRLVQEQGSDGRSASLHTLPKLFGTGVIGERVLPQSLLDGGFLFEIDQFAAIGPIQVEATFGSDQSQANRTTGLGSRILVNPKFAV